jgi:hypothetical protein
LNTLCLTNNLNNLNSLDLLNNLNWVWGKLTDRDNRIQVGQVAQPSGLVGGVLLPPGILLLKHVMVQISLVPGPAGSALSLPGKSLHRGHFSLNAFRVLGPLVRYDIYVRCLEPRAHFMGSSLLFLVRRCPGPIQGPTRIRLVNLCQFPDN